ncbi:SulP family inorganic anion transporter, partial [Cryobacterium sp. Y11]|uniref:SulP family inorganic anion transporter n=1 Tax=Cryobacterium sp. Y11 TaxID=2045016 RepID=UPI0011AFFB3A
MAIVQKSASADRYKAEPSVRTALRTPRLLTREVLAGLVVAMALIPEAIAFSIIAGVDPRVGLFSSFVMAVTISFVGGRPAMITAATGAIALVIAPLVAIVVLTVVTVTTAITVPTIGDQGELPKSLPELFLPNIPLNWETITIIAPYALGMALVGILESLMTAKFVDE